MRTPPEGAEAAEVVEKIQDNRLFLIDLNWYRENARSFEALAFTRLCAHCQASFHEEGDPKHLKVNSIASQSTGAPRENTSITQIFDRIAEHCSLQPEYLHPRLSMIESVFRVLLAQHNEPMTLGQIQERLIGSGKIREPAASDLSKTLGQLLANEQYYGIRAQVPSTTP